MTTETLRSWVSLPADCMFVPVANIESLLWRAIEDAGVADGISLEWGFNGHERVVSAILAWRDGGKLSVYATAGLGLIGADDFMRGFLRRDDFIRFVREKFNLEVRVADQPAGAAANAAVDGLPPLTSPQIAEAFNGIDDLSALQWRARLGKPPKWLEVERTRASIGTAPKPSTWWPLELARILAKRGVAYESLNRRFVNERALKPWLPRWQAERRERNGLEQ